MTKANQQARDEAIKRLREELKPGMTVHTVLRHVSRSGMMRCISPVITSSDGDPWDITFLASRALDYKCSDKHGGLVVGGCGMDMGFHVVYALSRTLFPEGFECAGKDGPNDCRSNDHSNGDRDYTPHHHRDGGYALKHRWL